MKIVVGDTASQPPSTKPDWREHLRRHRRGISRRAAALAAHRAARYLLNSPCLRNVRRCAVYLDNGSELGTKPLIAGLWRRGIAVYVPVIRPHHRLAWVRLRRHTPLRRGTHGIPTPRVGRPRCRVSSLDVIILPVLGFDARGTRLGAGGGYYDRLGQRPHHRPLRLGLAFASQRCTPLPFDAWDVPLRRVATDRRPPWPFG